MTTFKKGDVVYVVSPPEGSRLHPKHEKYLGVITTLVDRTEHPRIPGAYGWSLAAMIRDGLTRSYIRERCLRKLDNPGDDEVDSRDILVGEKETC